MLPYLNEEYGNPSSKFYNLAENAKLAVKTSRQHVATLLSCRLDEVIFTSGATESNNMILKGVADYYAKKGNHIVLPGVINFQLPGTNNELFIKKIAKDVAISTGSACSSDKPSHASKQPA